MSMTFAGSGEAEPRLPPPTESSGPELAHWPLPYERGTSLDGGAAVELGSAEGRAADCGPLRRSRSHVLKIGMLPSDERLSQAAEFTQAVACARERATAA